MTQRHDHITDNRSKDFVFVPFCMLAQAFHAQGLVKYEWGGNLTPLLKTILEADANIIQMPCLETLHHPDGLKRLPKGKKYYETPEFRRLCKDKAAEVIVQIRDLLKNGYRIAAILGMEYSPSCAVNLQWPPKKGEPNMGIFMQELRACLEEAGIDVPVIGINRRGMQKTVDRLAACLDQAPSRKERQHELGLAPPANP